ncbi:MAG: dTDP-Rha--alpha-D-GlcNAc-pyrophosphate polyprenol alpha-3-L-rhamnosyltransferase [Flavobacteriaceae bacterium]|nr:dTDP-Rha--alpha-D-GlcNAc-pyrophosphate polyprenol alpha-3-L-rhamnosyltransferase [Flavobacteriaceae bacterium]
MKTALMILNYNGEKFLKSYMPSIVQNSPEASIYLIDNGSNDNSINYIKKNFPLIKLVLHKKNLGFCDGYNKAVSKIDAELICFMNNDVTVKNKWLPPIIDHFKKNPKTVIAQPHILDLKSPEYFEYAGAAGGFIDRLGYPYCRGRVFNSIEKDFGQFDKTQKIFWASGACFFIRKETFNSLNGFDSDFFAHQEEIDLCWRAFNRGLDIVSIGKSKVFHLGEGTLQSSPKKTFLNFRNSLLSLLKNLPEKKTQRICERLFWDYIAFLFFLIKLKPLDAFAILRAHLSFFNSLNKIKKDLDSTNKQYFTINNLPIRYFIIGKKKFSSL